MVDVDRLILPGLLSRSFKNSLNRSLCSYDPRIEFSCFRAEPGAGGQFAD